MLIWEWTNEKLWFRPEKQQQLEHVAKLKLHFKLGQITLLTDFHSNQMIILGKIDAKQKSRKQAHW